MKLAILILAAFSIASYEAQAGIGGLFIKNADRFESMDENSGAKATALGAGSCVLGALALVCVPALSATSAITAMILLDLPNEGQTLQIKPELDAEVQAGRLTRDDADEIIEDLERIGVSELDLTDGSSRDTIENSLSDLGYHLETAQFIAGLLIR